MFQVIDARPARLKVAHFLGLGMFKRLDNNEWKFKVKLDDGTTYNPDYYDRDSGTFLEICTACNNFHQQGRKWREALKKIKLRVFWWEGEEMLNMQGKCSRPWMMVEERARQRAAIVLAGGRPRKDRT